MEAVALRYAESLFDLAVEVNQIEAYVKDIDLIREVFESIQILFHSLVMF